MTQNEISAALGGPKVIKTSRRGEALLRKTSYNKGLAFTAEERNNLGLNGVLPSSVLTMDQQLQLEWEHLQAKSNDLEKYIYLASLQDRNETLFYRLLCENLHDLMPIVYTPTVGYACKQYSHIFRKTRGLWLTPGEKGRFAEVLKNTRETDIRLIVVTDNDRILGLGDQGCGGMGIPIGKLALYTAGAGIHPSKCLPVSLDFGTNNPELLNDPLYAGYRSRRLKGDEYDQLIEEFVTAVTEVYPRAIIQWEDFKKENAFRILDRYVKRVPSFNDDIQGTAGVVLAGVYAALRKLGQKMSEQRVLFYGGGASATGICRLIRLAMRQESAGEDTIRRAQMLMDSRGLLHTGRDITEPFKRECAISLEDLATFDIEPHEGMTVEDLISKFKPTILIGATATPGLFTESIVKEMGKHVERPVIMPLSNPTAKSECTPQEAIEWTEGRAIVATGSPFPDVEYNGTRHVIGQANNVFIFPGVGMGAAVAEVREITQTLFLIAAQTAAECVSPERLELGALYPNQNDLRKVSAAIAKKIVKYASQNNLGRFMTEGEAVKAVDEAMWWPDYVPVEPK